MLVVLNGKRLGLLPLYAVTLLIAGCGGGGGGDSGGATAPGGGSTPPTGTVQYEVGGTVSGLTGSGLVLQLNGTSDLALESGTAFKFPTKLAAGTTYVVTVRSNPDGQTCAVTAGGSGVLASADVSTITVSCSSPPVTVGSFSVGGALSGLTASGLVLTDGSQEVRPAANATQFAFPLPLTEGSSYSVGIGSQPTGLACAIANASGVVHAVVTTISVTCSPLPPAPGLSIDKSSLKFEAEQGAPLATQIVVGSINGATDPVIVKVKNTYSGLDWAIYKQVSAYAGQVEVGPQATNRKPGTYNDTVTITACYDNYCSRHVPGSPKVIPVTTIIHPPQPERRLLVSRQGVALTSVAGKSVLTRSLKVKDSSGAAGVWTAASNQAWLTVTASGSNGGDLQLVANKTGLADGFHEAIVEVTPGDAALSAQTIKVGFYLSASTPATMFQISPVLNAAHHWQPPVNWEVDPVRPLTYNANGDSIAIDHVYTGLRAGVMTIAGADYQGITVSSDGRFLYAVNTASKRLDVFDLAVRSRIKSLDLGDFSEASDFGRQRIQFANVQGRPVIVFGIFSLIKGRSVAPVIAADSGSYLGSYASPGSDGFDAFTISGDGNVVYAAPAGLSGMLSAVRSTLEVNSLGNVYGVMEAVTVSTNSSSLQDIATNQDGSKLFISWQMNEIAKYAIDYYEYSSGDLLRTSWLPITDAYGLCSNVEVDLQDNLACLRFSDSLLRIYAPDRSLTREASGTALGLAYTRLGSLRYSSDGMRLLGNGVMVDVD